MVMEYMCHGDLLGFLRACRGHPGMYTISPGNRYQPPSLQLCSRDLLNMATKIANGMRYLADRKVSAHTHTYSSVHACVVPVRSCLYPVTPAWAGSALIRVRGCVSMSLDIAGMLVIIARSIC